MAAKQQNHNYTSPLRYPGGKGALANFIKKVIADNQLTDGEYAEVYAGGASIAWALLFEEYIRIVHVNDLNQALMAFWRSVIISNDGLCQLIRDTPVTIDEWYRQREVQARPGEHSQLQLGFSTFFLNRTNRSGILSGGVIGGKGQTGKWKLDARFNKNDLVRRVQRIGRYANRIKLYNLDAVDFIQCVLPELPKKTFIYLDPPYYTRGQDLYENYYGKQDHLKVAGLMLEQSSHPWIVSYDAEPEILGMYSAFRNIQYNISYSAQGRYVGSEVMFYSDGLGIPAVQTPAALRRPTLARQPRSNGSG